MHVSLLSRLFLTCLILLILTASSLASVSLEEAAKLLPDKIGEAIATSNASAPRYGISEHSGTANLPAVSAAMRHYVLPSGEKFELQLFKMPSDSGAYSLLTTRRFNLTGMSTRFTNLTGLGTIAVNTQRQIEFVEGTKDTNAAAKNLLISELIFAKGTFVINIFGDSTQDTNNVNLVSLARIFADTLDEGSGEIPVLVKHLPDWETAQERGVYAVTLPALKEVVRDQPVLDVVSFEGGTEAVTATYDQGARLVVVEYATPQFAFDGDAAITARIAELRGEGKLAPSAYRRVGNYAVFVFGAPDETAATALIGRVHYEKDVRWLGNNPHANERFNRAWLNMSTSVIVNTIKAAGIAILGCLAVGGLFGGAIFMRRRAQADVAENYSDAGGMLRLNLDDLNAPHEASRLIGQGDK